jgi:hypothetical protein
MKILITRIKSTKRVVIIISTKRITTTTIKTMAIEKIITTISTPMKRWIKIQKKKEI